MAKSKIWEKLATIKARVAVIVTLVGFLVTGTVWTYSKVDSFLHWKANVDSIIGDKDRINHVDEKVLKLVEDYETSKDSAREAVDYALDRLDSIKAFVLEAKPIIQQFKEIDDIGLKRHKLTGKMRYLATNGELYRAFWSDIEKRYYYIDDNQKAKWCE